MDWAVAGAVAGAAVRGTEMAPDPKDVLVLAACAAEAIARIVGHDRRDMVGTSLIDQIRRNPFSVVLLDEFEKSHPQVWDLFLQVFDDGRLTDQQGMTADFRNRIIILTSNLGSALPKGPGLGFVGSPPRVPETVEQAVATAITDVVEPDASGPGRP
jgi:ATP-dependent Clp protease ATP-binding subunit ClpA